LSIHHDARYQLHAEINDELDGSFLSDIIQSYISNMIELWKTNPLSKPWLRWLKPIVCKFFVPWSLKAALA
jgi:hypothetical protein